MSEERNHPAAPPMSTANGRDKSVSASTRAAPTRAPQSDTAVGTDTNHIPAGYASGNLELTRFCLGTRLRIDDGGPRLALRSRARRCLRGDLLE